MAHQRKTWKRFMKTILSQLPTYIEKYTLPDQVFLNDFLSILRYYEVDTQQARWQLLERFKKFVDKYRSSGQMWDLPFLWFAESYFTNASKLLRVASFHADDFYEYLVKHLRGDSDVSGVFKLIRNGVTLTDLKWEQLQYASNRLSVPLTSEELHALEAVHELYMETGIKALDQKYIKNIIINRVKSPTLSKKLVNLFSRVDSTWLLQFYNPAFDIEELFFHFQLSKSTSLEEIIDFKNSNNTILCRSRVYWIRGFHNMYCGVFYVPLKFVESLEKYLHTCQRRGQLILHELTKLTNPRICVSLFLYQAIKSWRNPTVTDRYRLGLMLKTQRPRKKRINPTSLYITPRFNELWHYSQLHDRSQVIELYCKIPRVLSYRELNLSSNNSQSFINLSKPEINVLKRLWHQKTFNISFFSLGLIYEFSLDNYWIKLPKMPLDQLLRLLAWLPYSVLYFAETNIYIWTYLTSELVQWLSTDLNWTIIPIVENHKHLKLTYDWYSPETQQWKAPHVL